MGTHNVSENFPHMFFQPSPKDLHFWQFLGGFLAAVRGIDILTLIRLPYEVAHTAVGIPIASRCILTFALPPQLKVLEKVSLQNNPVQVGTVGAFVCFHPGVFALEIERAAQPCKSITPFTSGLLMYFRGTQPVSKGWDTTHGYRIYIVRVPQLAPRRTHEL